MENQAGTEEKRRYIRTDTSIPMTLRLREGKDAREIQSITRNISATGMMIELQEQLPIGTEIKIDLSTPDSANPVHCSGKVVWSAPISEGGRYNSGIAFSNIEEDNKNTFLKFLCDTIYKTGGRQ